MKVINTDYNLFSENDCRLYSVETRKRCLCAYDDKRVLLKDGISTLAFGHKSIEAIQIEEPADENPQTVVAYEVMHPREAERMRQRKETQAKSLTREDIDDYFDKGDEEDNCSYAGEEGVKDEEEIKEEPDIDIGF